MLSVRKWQPRAAGTIRIDRSVLRAERCITLQIEHDFPEQKGWLRVAELPELLILSEQLEQQFRGRTVTEVEVTQPKCLNVSPEEFSRALLTRRFGRVRLLGKWICCDMAPGYKFLLNLGMGADVRYSPPGASLPDKYQLSIRFDDASSLWCRFWWFGHAHVVADEEMDGHARTAELGPLACSPQADRDWFHALVRSSARSGVKSLLMNQKKISGLGNAYMHDILFGAGIHPLRKCGDLSPAEVDALYRSIGDVVEKVRRLGGFERDLYGQGGNVETPERLLVIGYREGEACPQCGTPVEKIKTGSTSGFICPECQPLGK